MPAVLHHPDLYENHLFEDNESTMFVSGGLTPFTTMQFSLNDYDSSQLDVDVCNPLWTGPMGPYRRMETLSVGDCMFQKSQRALVCFGTYASEIAIESSKCYLSGFAFHMILIDFFFRSYVSKPLVPKNL